VKLEEALFDITGNADLKHDNMLDIRISGVNPDFKQLLSFAPEDVKKQLGRFKYDGRLSFTACVKRKFKGKAASTRRSFVQLRRCMAIQY
jgi:hypothetical protein